MSRALKLLMVLVLTCVAQTTLSGYIRIAGVAPDLLIVCLVLLTSYCGAYGGFCAGALLSLLYDASVGYVLAINLVGYTFLGWAAPMLRSAMDKKLKKMKHKSYLEMMLICFFLTLLRELLYIGYLFLIGSEQSMITIVRMLLCAAYSALMILPCGLLIGVVMHRRPKKKGSDLYEDDAVTNR